MNLVLEYSEHIKQSVINRLATDDNSRVNLRKYIDELEKLITSGHVKELGELVQKKYGIPSSLCGDLTKYNAEQLKQVYEYFDTSVPTEINSNIDSFQVYPPTKEWNRASTYNNGDTVLYNNRYWVNNHDNVKDIIPGHHLSWTQVPSFEKLIVYCSQSEAGAKIMGNSWFGEVLPWCIGRSSYYSYRPTNTIYYIWKPDIESKGHPAKRKVMVLMSNPQGEVVKVVDSLNKEYNAPSGQEPWNEILNSHPELEHLRGLFCWKNLTESEELEHSMRRGHDAIPFWDLPWRLKNALIHSTTPINADDFSKLNVEKQNEYIEARLNVPPTDLFSHYLTQPNAQGHSYSLYEYAQQHGMQGRRYGYGGYNLAAYALRLFAKPQAARFYFSRLYRKMSDMIESRTFSNDVFTIISYGGPNNVITYLAANDKSEVWTQCSVAENYHVRLATDAEINLGLTLWPSGPLDNFEKFQKTYFDYVSYVVYNKVYAKQCYKKFKQSITSEITCKNKVYLGDTDITSLYPTIKIFHFEDYSPIIDIDFFKSELPSISEINSKCGMLYKQIRYLYPKQAGAVYFSFIKQTPTFLIELLFEGRHIMFKFTIDSNSWRMKLSVLGDEGGSDDHHHYRWTVFNKTLSGQLARYRQFASHFKIPIPTGNANESLTSFRNFFHVL